MTVWAKLQSWIGAAASGVNLDNEFNNIYTGLNESQNGSLPNGYNDVRLTFTGNQLTVKGESKVMGVNVNLNSTITVSGANGWRYIVSTTGGVVSVETIPGAEITANTLIYTPSPVFNNTHNGYYSTVNVNKRIIGILFFDNINNIIEVLAYGNGYRKKDNQILGINGTDAISGIGARLQYTNAPTFQRGSDITIVDNGAGTTDSEGVRITSLRSQKLNIFGNISMSAASGGTSSQVDLHKNGILYMPNISSIFNNTSGTISIIDKFSIIDSFSNENDYYTIVISAGGTVNVTLVNIGAIAE